MKSLFRNARSVVRGTALASALAVSTLMFTACDVSDAGNGGDKAEGSGEINLYTSEPEAKINEVIDAFNKENPDIQVKVFRAGTGELKTRIASEKKSGKIGADVLLAADVPTFEGFKSEDELIKLDNVETDGIEKEQVDADGYYVGTRIIPTVIAYNKDKVKEAPKSWAELTDPKFKEQIAMPNPDVSGAAAFNTALWLDQPELGEDWLKKLGENKPKVLESNGPVAQAVADGSSPLGVVVDYPVRDLADKGSPVAVSYPSDGVPYVNQPAGVFKDSENPDAAQAFVSFLVSKEGQELAVKQNYVPIRSDAGAPEGAPALTDINLIQPDYAKVKEQQDGAVEKFKEIMG
ncbi:iron(III) transport system substrate-binding protein [Brevibacterium paucivorans]|uniref:Iron(III) transport system substrate-binding protein n=3 Tax=Brevibacterium TaxID=1696 RepID=A0ABS2SKQ8_9MICO|nr:MULTISPECIES: ABC transporter substrate-binding protein [Brevibacterium]MBM7816838.1 iron(III) transport system substrate-binding protein [Brevibacterium paucivorans]MCG7298246.1 ABC transporter substrate-binding protein [Brevibacterium sp. ACRRH]